MIPINTLNLIRFFAHFEKNECWSKNTKQHMESKEQPEFNSKRRRFAFFNLTNEKVIDLLSYSKYLYYIGIIETILYTVSVIGIPMIGFTLLATSFNDSPSLERVNIVINI